MAYMLYEEAEDDDIMLQMCEVQRDNVHPMYRSRRKEGFFNQLIETHLKTDDRKFRKFLRLNPFQFNYVLNFIKDDIKCNSYNRVLYPITAAEKLAITLR